MNLEKLKEPFAEKDVEWRISRSGITNDKPWATALCYITARAAMDRLDEVVGAGNWKDTYTHLPNGVLCTLAIKIGGPNGEWVAKQNGADESDIESFKGGISNAFKRAAVNWGIGRYLYDLTESFVEFSPNKTGNSALVKDKKSGKEMWVNWMPPKLPAWALPLPPVKVTHDPAAAKAQSPATGGQEVNQQTTAPIPQQPLAPQLPANASANAPAATEPPVGKSNATAPSSGQPVAPSQPPPSKKESSKAPATPAFRDSPLPEGIEEPVSTANQLVGPEVGVAIAEICNKYSYPKGRVGELMAMHFKPKTKLSELTNAQGARMILLLKNEVIDREIKAGKPNPFTGKMPTKGPVTPTQSRRA
jgi:hypothetical protein